MNIYVASSWRNGRHEDVVAAITAAGHAVYDYRHPAPGVGGFQWSELDPHWQQWDAAAQRDALNYDKAVEGYLFDIRALADCDACVLVMPSGRSAHLEAGFARGRGATTIVLLDDDAEPELMYKMADHLCLSIAEVVDALAVEAKED
jgi:hypothetical protein